MRNKDSLLGRARPAERLTKRTDRRLGRGNLNSRRSPTAHEARSAAGNPRTQANSE